MQQLGSGKRRWRNVAGSVLGIALFVAATWLLQRELRAYQFRDIYEALVEIPGPRLALALALTAANFIVLSGIDHLALLAIGRRLHYPKTLLASFSGFATSQALGFPLLTAATVRFRLYTRWGVSAQEVTAILAFCGLSFFLGLFAILGVVLLVTPAVPAEVLRLPLAVERAVGALLLLVVAAYLAWSRHRSQAIRIRGWTLPTSSARISVVQVAVAALDWVLVASIVYVLLPAGLLSFPAVIQIVVLAQMMGITSNVPGGLGVFEAVVLLLLPAAAPENLVLASLLAYRAIYTLLPLLAAAILLSVNEMVSRRRSLELH